MTKIDEVLQQLTTIQATQAIHSTMLRNLRAGTINIKATLQDLAKSVSELAQKLDSQLPLLQSSSPPTSLTSTVTASTSAAPSPKSPPPPPLPPANSSPPSPKFPTPQPTSDMVASDALKSPSPIFQTNPFPSNLSTACPSNTIKLLTFVLQPESEPVTQSPNLIDSSSIILSFNDVAEITHLDLSGKFVVTDVDNDNHQQSRPRRFSDLIVSEPTRRSSENFTRISVGTWDARSNIVWIPISMSLEYLEMGYRNFISEMMLIRPYFSLESSIKGPKSPIIYVFPLLQTNTHPEATQFVDLQFNYQTSFIATSHHVLESNAMKGHEGKIFIFDPGSKMKIDFLFVARFIRSDTWLQHNLDITTSTLQPLAYDLEDKVDFKGSAMIQ